VKGVHLEEWKWH